MSLEAAAQGEQLFNDSLASGPERQAAFPDGGCSHDPALRTELASLLIADRAARAAGILDTPAPLAASSGDAWREGQRVGVYTVLRQIGSGGMGAVFLAERRDVGKRVAIKFLRVGLHSAEAAGRFMLERRLLATLDHPNVASWLDAGVTKDGEPYLVMEYVDGETITECCRTQALDVRQRLALFTTVCGAVQFAHEHLVVHRDLKPSNILVGRDGVVKLLDFGIAKVLESAAEEELTRTAVQPMTPDYAAPEQVRARPVTTATDVYALGMILYEVLAGQRPYDLRGSSLVEIERVICEIDPPRPSTVGRRASQSTTDVVDGAARHAPLPWRSVQGDLDTICLKALEKDPARRYPTARALQDDIDRYLTGLPILARPSTPWYRSSKFVRRHRVAAGAAVLAGVSLLAGLGGATWQAVRAARERARAQRALAESEAVSTFLTGLFRASDPSTARGDTLTAKELLDQGVERIDSLSQQPQVQGRLLDVMGRVYQSLGRFDQAQPLLERALRVRRHVLGATHGEVAESWTHLGDLSMYRGRYDEAEEQLRKALAIHTVTHGRTSVQAASDLHLLGAVLVDQGKPQQGRLLFDEALAIRRRELPSDPLEIAESLSGLAYAAASLGDYEDAEQRYTEALELLRRELPPPHPRLALGLNNLATALDSRGRFDDAARLHREALAMRRVLFGEDHPAVATSLNNLNSVLVRQAKYGEAEPIARQVVAIRTRLLGADHPTTVNALSNLAVVLFRSGRPYEAVPVMQEAHAAARKRLADDHPRMLNIDARLAPMVAAIGRDEEAEHLFARALAGLRKALGPEHPDIAATLLLYGRFLSERRRFVEAEPLLAQSFAMRIELLGARHPDSWRAARELAALYRSTGNSAKAEATERAVSRAPLTSNDRRLKTDD